MLSLLKRTKAQESISNSRALRNSGIAIEVSLTDYISWDLNSVCVVVDCGQLIDGAFAYYRHACHLLTAEMRVNPGI